MKDNSVNLSEMMDDFEKVCKARGLKITHQRTEIFKALLEHNNHPSTEDVFNKVRLNLKTISLDTVYRTIATFEEYGLIKRVHHIDNTTRFDINLTDHHHLVCSNCNKIEDFYWPDFDKMKPPKSVSAWGQIDIKHVVINGLCASCNKRKVR